ncbi:polysaccharide deacetylase family protein [Paenibacillus sp. P25]|nr:polysaccharide deacetylase family protein [Paenibacillus sp. P25]
MNAQEAVPVRPQAAAQREPDAGPGTVHAALPAVPQTGSAAAEPKPEPVPSQAPAPQAPAPHEKLAALTFDDGPDGKYTPQVLDILKKYEVKATFFVVGTQAGKYPEILQRIHQEGHAIGNHSWDHADLTKLSAEQIDKEIRETDELIRSTVGEAPSLVRAPYGAAPEALKDELKQAGRPLVGWTVDPRDWAGSPSRSIVSNIKSHIKPGGIILLHSFGGRHGRLDNTVQALPEIIAYLKEEGYKLVTVTELLQAGQHGA